MLAKKGIFLVTVLSITDFVLTTVLFGRGTKFYETFSHVIGQYSFTNSVLELWLLAVLRVAIILGSVIGLCCNKNVGVGRVKKSNKLILVVAGLQCMFTLVKLLAVSEKGQFLHEKWFWWLWAWSVAGTVLLYIEWKLLGNVKFVRDIRGLIINDGEVKQEECESLLGNDRKKEDENKSTGKPFPFKTHLFISC